MRRRLLLACALAALVAVPTYAAPQDLTTLLALFLRNLHAGRIVIPVMTTFANLGTPADGTIVFCSDCSEGEDPATDGGNGAFALRQDGRWLTLDGGAGAGGVTDAEYWVGAAHADLSAEKDLSGFTGLVLNTTGTPSGYGGTSCTNQFPRSLNASGAATCASVANADLAGSIAASKLVGTDIATVGTITTGTWNGTDIAVADGGTGASTSQAAIDNLSQLTTEGDILRHDGSNTTRLAKGAIGTFLRVNTFVAGDLEWGIGPNVSDQNADATSSSNTVTTTLTDMISIPDPDTWTGFTCTIVYESAATTTGITVSLFANNVGSTGAPQYFTSKFTIGGFGAAGGADNDGTDPDWIAHIATQGTLVTTTGVLAANTPYVIKIDALLLTHASATDAFIAPQFRSEVNLSTVTIKEGSYCKSYVLHVDS